MVTRHTLTHADKIYVGDAFYARYSPDGRRGLELTHSYIYELGAVAVGDSDGFATTQGLATTGLTLTGALMSGGVWTADVPRSVAITSATGADLSSVTFTINGTDFWGETLSEAIAGSATTVITQKAFKTVTSIVPSASSANTAFAGTATTAAGTKFGMPVRLKDKGVVLGIFVDGVPETALTIVAGLATTTTPTATNADVRGTIAPNTVPDGTKRYTLNLYVPDHSLKETLFGATPA